MKGGWVPGCGTTPDRVPEMLGTEREEAKDRRVPGSPREECGESPQTGAKPGATRR